MRPAGAPSVAATLGTPGKARRPRTGAPAARGLRGGVAISGIFEGGATQPDGMQRRSNADGVAPRAASRSEVADAVMKGDRTAVRTLLQRKADVNAPQVDGATAL